jgi:hypothetical protein
LRLRQVGDVVRLWRGGFKAAYVFLAPQPEALLRARLAAHVYAHPPPGYDVDDAGALAGCCWGLLGAAGGCCWLMWSMGGSCQGLGWCC